MLTCTLTKKNMESLSAVVKEKNQLSPLNRFIPEEGSSEDKMVLTQIGFIDEEGELTSIADPVVKLLSKPYAVIKMSFTGGANVFEHSINYDSSFNNHVTLTATQQDFCIDDVAKPNSILKILKDFIGVSNLKSINISGRYSIYEAMVIAAVLDIERRAELRSFIDELPITQASCTVNMIWRITNSTSPSIQWFVSILNDITGSNETMTLQQVQQGIEGLLEKGVLVKNGETYQSTGEMAKLSGRMIIIDNILSSNISLLGNEDSIISTGFTCIQSGVHDLLFIDYDGTEIAFETITSVSLLDCIEQFLNGKAIFS